MSSPPHDDSGPFVLRPVRHRHGGPAGHGLPGASPAVLTFWLHFPYQGFRWGYRCPGWALTGPGTRSVHGRCATDGRRGTDLLAGHLRARRVKAGVRTRCGERAGGGLRTGRAPGAGEATPAHAPARPLVTGRRGGAASTRLAGTAPHPRAESADTTLTARPARGCDPRLGGLVRPFPDDLPPAPCSVRGPGGLWRARGPARFTRGKAPFAWLRLSVSVPPGNPPGRLLGR
jgi:hypothetical protein